MVDWTTALETAAALFMDQGSAPDPDIDIKPNNTGLPGIAVFQQIVGAGMTIGLIASVAALLISAVVWAFGSRSANPSLAGQGKQGVLIACGVAVICGASVTLVMFFWDLGQRV